ncbi:MAG: GntR family transcriptional regulator [Burkholderiales bacterium]|nr:GntR family transcriptional regulator [Burkholderiales bacterium]
MDSRTTRRRPQLDAASRMPLYHQLRAALEESWQRLGPDAVLPTEREIIERYAVSRITVRRALDELMADGVIRRQRPRGRLHLVPPRVYQQLNRLRGFFWHDALAAGQSPDVRVLEVGQAASPEINRHLRLPADAMCYRIARLHTSEGRALSHQVSYIPTSDCPDLRLSDLSGSLLQMMEQRYGRRAQHAEQRLLVREASAAECNLLQLAPGSMVFEVDRVSYDTAGKPIEYFVSALDVARFEFHTSMDAAADGDGAARTPASPWLPRR